MRDLKHLKIAVIYGGVSKERPGSLISGRSVLDSLSKQGYNAIQIDPSKHDLYKKLRNVDVVFIALHGRYGEDGKLQGFLETLQLSYTGSGVLASSLAMDKYYFKKVLNASNIPILDCELVYPGQFLSRNYFERLTRRLGLPFFIKPLSEGGSLGANVIHSKKQFLQHIKEMISEEYDVFLAERYIKGPALTVGVIEIDQKLVTLPVLETVSKKEFYDYQAKHDSALREYYCPARISKILYNKIQNLAEKVHRLLRCHGYSRVDFIVSKNNEPFVLEVNTLPGLSKQGNMATMAEAAGILYDDLIVHILKTAFTRSSYLP